MTFMWHTKSQAKPQTYSDSHCFIIKPQPTWRYWHCLKPVSTMWEWSSHKRKPAVPVCSNWTSLELCVLKRRDDPRRVVLAAYRPEECQTDDQSVRNDCKESLSEQTQSARMSAWSQSVLAADAKKAGSASEDTRLTPRPPSFTGRLA